jgi:hypothetical protein
VKNSLLLAASFVLLASCSKGDDPKSTTSASGIVSCPNLNGTYATADGQDSLYIATQVQDGKTYYSMKEGSGYVPADGVTRHSEDGRSSLTVTCGNNSVVLHVERAGEPNLDVTLTDIGNDQIRGETEGHVEILTKQGIAHNQPTPAPEPHVQCPVLSGTYVNGADSQFIDTQVNGASYAYKFTMSQAVYLPADGALHAMDGGSYRVSCGRADRGYVSYELNQNGRDPLRVEIEDLGGDQIQVTRGGQTAIYQKR